MRRRRDSVPKPAPVVENFKLIDVSRFCITDAPPHCEYVTVSYVWGHGISSRYQATLGNIKTLQERDGLNPLSFRLLYRTPSRLAGDWDINIFGLTLFVSFRTTSKIRSIKSTTWTTSMKAQPFASPPQPGMMQCMGCRVCLNPDPGNR